MRGEGHGVIGDVTIALIGGFIGGLVSSLVLGDASWWLSIAAAFLGDCILVALVPAHRSLRWQRM